MEYTRKMALIPESMLNKTTSSDALQPTAVKKTIQLDDEIKQILENPGLNDYDKVRLYTDALNQFRFHKNQVVQPPYVRIKREEPSRVLPEPPERTDKDEILATVPKTLTSKAVALIDKLEKIPNLDWNEKGVVNIDGRDIGGSNIIDLVNDLLRKRKRFNPTGWQFFRRPYRNTIYVGI